MTLNCVLLKDRKPWHPDRVPKLILELGYDYYQVLATMPSAG